MWNLFKSISGEEFITKVLRGRKPRVLFLTEKLCKLPDFPKEYKNSSNEIEKKAVIMKITKSLELIYTYLKVVHKKLRYIDICEFIAKYIIYAFNEEYFIPYHLKVGQYCRKSEELQSMIINKLYKIIEQYSITKIMSNKDNLFIYHGLSYLSMFVSNLSNDDFLKIAFSLFDAQYTQLVLLNLIEFIKKFFSIKRENIHELQQVIDKFVIHTWNFSVYSSQQDNKQTRNCHLLQNLIFELFIAAHIQMQPKNEDEDEDDQDFLKDGCLLVNDSNPPTEINDEIFKNVQNNEFINNVKIWLYIKYDILTNDSKTQINEINYNAPFINIPSGIIDDLNKYKLGNKFTNIHWALKKKQ